jgi:AcrR family transcriptional regulator
MERGLFDKEHARGSVLEKDVKRPKGTIDRRVARTRALLQKAHLSLILEKGYEAMTVEDICEAANVGRSTFYAHYSSKEDLKRSGLEHLRRELMAHRAAAPPTADDRSGMRLDFSLPMFEHAREHLDLYRALVGSRGGSIAISTIRQILADLVRADLAGAEVWPQELPREFAVQFLVGAYMAVLTWWLDSGAKSPPRDMDGLFRRMAFRGLTDPS